MKNVQRRRFATLVAAVLVVALVAVGPVTPAEAAPAPCVGDVVIGSQAEMDAFNCSVVTGLLLIDSVADLTNVDALSVLTAVDSALYVRSNPLLTNVDGLSSLVTGGNLSVFITGNPLLTNVDGLSSLENVKQNLVITDNAALTNVDGLSSLFRVGSVIAIRNNAVLADLDGLSSLSQPPFGGYVHIDGNPSLVNVDGLSSMTATGELEITDNGALTNLNGLSGLTELRGDMAISGNASLADLSGLSSLTRVNASFTGSGLAIANNGNLPNLNGLGSLVSVGALTVNNNANLTSLAGLASLGAIFRDLTITNNATLGNCASLFDLLNDRQVSGPVTISGNASGCASLEDLLGIAPCIGNVSIASQAEVDGFRCSTVTGDLSIESVADLTNLDGMWMLNSVDGALRIQSDPGLTQIDGLSSLGSIGGDLTIESNSVLADVDGLTTVASVGGDVRVAGNSILGSCATGLRDLLIFGGISGSITIENNAPGCSSVEEITTSPPEPCVGDVVIGSQAEMDAFNCSVVTGLLLIDSVADLTNVDALSVLTAVDSALYVRSNPLLTNVDGLSSLVTGGNLSVFITGNPLLTNVDGLSSLENVKQNLVITDNAALTNVDGLSSLFRVGSVIAIRNNAVLADLDGLSSLSQPPFGGYVHIDGNPSLVNVDGLSSMTATGELEITDNGALTNLNGLSGLTELRGNLAVTGNSVLGRCSSLFSLLDGGLVAGSESIFGNAPGCNSVAEILADLGVDRTVAAHFLSNSCPLRPLAEPIGAGDSATFAVPAGCGVPGEADAVLVSLWAVDPVAEGNLRLGPAGDGSTLGVVNFGANGLENTNSLWVPLSASGELELSVNGGAAAPGTVLAAAVQLEILGWSGSSTEPGLLYHPVNPCAFFDSRGNQGSANPGPHMVGEQLVVDLAGGHPAGQGGGQTDCGVPVGADAALVNVTLIQPTGEIGLANNTTGASLVFNEPLSAPFNNASAVVVPLDANGALSIDVIGTTGTAAHVRTQVLGYFDDSGVPGGLIYNPISPCVAFDSRANQNAADAFAGQRTGGQITTYDVVGAFDPAQGGGNSDCGVPADAEAVELNFVGVNAVREGNLRVSAAGVVPEGGVLNFGALVPKMNNANAAVVLVSAGGEIDVFMNGGILGAGLPIADVRGTITGYWAVAVAAS